MTSLDSTRYEKRIAELFERHQSVQSAGFTSEAYKPGLDGMRALDAALGNPSGHLRCIHVAGTNGKGSVCSMLAASLAAPGRTVGLYTSPHLLDFRERIKVVEGDSMRMIPREDVWEFLESFEDRLAGRSFFEITTGLAFWWFARQEVDVAVIEVGLGGRLDSTNIITPELSIVTSIGLDHCALLGGTRAEIAAEKAGIFKPAVPALVGTTDEQTAPVFEAAAARVHCPLFFADQCESCCDMPEMDLTGPCQDVNFATVAAALDLLGEEPELEAISHTARITGFHGRWEKISDNPETICDIGHNPPALKENFAMLQSLGRPLVIVYGVMADKDLDGIAPLMPSGAEYVLVAPATSRAMDACTLSARLSALRPDLSTRTAPDVRTGMKIAIDLASAHPECIIYVGGSTFVVAEAMQNTV